MRLAAEPSRCRLQKPSEQEYRLHTSTSRPLVARSAGARMKCGQSGWRPEVRGAAMPTLARALPGPLPTHLGRREAVDHNPEMSAPTQRWPGGRAKAPLT